jgi:hypothetical protein
LGRANSVRHYFAHLFSCFALFRVALSKLMEPTLTGTPNDIVCLCASEHLPCCTNCTEGFAIPLDIKGLIESKFQSSNEVACEDENDLLKETSRKIQDDDMAIKGREAANKHSGLKVKSESAKPRQGPALVDSAEPKICNHALAAAVDGRDEENMKPPPAVQDNEKGRGAANNERFKQSAAQPRGPSLIDLAERKIISHALSDGHDDDVIVQIGQHSGHKVIRGAMQSLKPGQWIKDEVVNSFFHLLSQRDGELCKNDVTQKGNGFFNSFFMTKLLNEGHSDPSRSGEYEYNNIRSWSTKFVPGEDIFEVDKLFFPINVERVHWVLAVADILNQTIQMYDSGSRLYNYQSIGKNGIRCLETLFRYLQDEHLDRKNAPLPNTNRWQLIPCQSDTPQQQNGKLA